MNRGNKNEKKYSVHKQLNENKSINTQKLVLMKYFFTISFTALGNNWRERTKKKLTKNFPTDNTIIIQINTLLTYKEYVIQLEICRATNKPQRSF